ncbi:MAG: 23S rRNA (uridine(2552)-2'-O)-methyltransferase [Candidatus Hecatellales archaeon]|nr:MAG: 23S rRNA (uridine(2552)-2'-O)-methyltransferase [Candidatus Hecatellales archaeon]
MRKQPTKPLRGRLRRKLTRNWRLERRQDHYYWRAKREGYRSRAAYKLLEIHRKYGLLKPGFKVLDLGCSPGGWLQVALNIVGPKGRVLGVDVNPIKPFKAENLSFLQCDLRKPELPSLILKKLGGKADVVLSDASPNISGVWEVDHARQMELAEAAYRTALETLKPGGSLLVKVFEGDLLEGFRKTLKENFGKVRIVKPKASRSRSAEVYLLAEGFKGG